MDRRLIVVLLIAVLLVVTCAAPGCRAANPNHWSFPVVSWMSEHSAGPNGGAVVVAMFFGLFFDLLIFPVTGIRDLIWTLSQPPGAVARNPDGTVEPVSDELPPPPRPR